MPNALDLLFNWRPMSEVSINTPVLVRIGSLVFHATWTNGAWKIIGGNLRLKTPPLGWTPIVRGEGQ